MTWPRDNEIVKALAEWLDPIPLPAAIIIAVIGMTIALLAGLPTEWVRKLENAFRKWNQK